MKLPNFKHALVPEAKITLYLLSEEKSGGKSAFFILFGFKADTWETLRDALINHASTSEVQHVSETSHGIKYITSGASL